MERLQFSGGKANNVITAVAYRNCCTATELSVSDRVVSHLSMIKSDEMRSTSIAETRENRWPM